MDEFNLYCDESCHLEHDSSNIMVIGSIWCPKNKIKEINNRIAELKERNNISKNEEIKWTKIAKSNLQLYKDLVNYFFDNDDLHFRVYVANKENLDHKAYQQTHDDWYYKIYFEMLNIIFNKNHKYNIYVDIKDVHSYEKCQKLLQVCRNNEYDFNDNHILKVQPIRSNEIQIIQLADVLIGAMCYENRKDIIKKSNSKKELIKLISDRSDYSLKRNSYLTEKKFNIFFWGFYPNV